ncbi:T9SS type A sorting domain-containing protein [bacterium]|nr:T9SS type A sorting domain-containing protein [bacterium]
MKPFIAILLCIFLCEGLAIAQQNFSYQQSKVFEAQPTTVSLSKVDTQWLVQTEVEYPKPDRHIDAKKAAVDLISDAAFPGKLNYKKDNSAFTPKVQTDFEANSTNGTPADNNMAISNDGIILSAVNSNVRIYKENGDLVATRMLAAIAKDAGNYLSSAFDPHTLYDPEADRFILIFLSGSNSNKTFLVVGFSQSNDPAGDWNFYQLPGNVHGDKTWSDYPFMGITHDELFIPVLLWQNGESGWDSESSQIIWQIDKSKGYAGEKLNYKYYDDIKIGNRLIWNTRPVWGSMAPYGPNMYFLSNRAIDLSNDTIFLFEITNTLASGKAELKLKTLRANKAYGIPPSAKQPRRGDSLRTNYADIHAAFLHYGRIHFTGNSLSEETGRAGIYYGVLSNPDSENPTVEARVYSKGNLDLNYPNMAYAGGGGIDRSFIIHCLHSAADVNPGSSTFFVDRNGNFSELVSTKEGLGPINVMSGDQERWGDYTGAQRKYNENGVVWCMGSYGAANGVMASHVVKIENTDPQLGFHPAVKSFELNAYPNPADEWLKLHTKTTEGDLWLSICDLNGRIIRRQKILTQGGEEMELLVPVGFLPAGSYLIKLESASAVETLRFVKN